MLNVVPKLAGNLNLEVLDDLPTLGAVAPGQVLTQDQVKKRQLSLNNSLRKKWLRLLG